MKKFVLIFVLTVLISMLLVGCSTYDMSLTEKKTEEKSGEFILLEYFMNYDVVAHKASKVVYIISHGTYNGGTATVMLDAEGKPLTMDKYFEEKNR